MEPIKLSDVKGNQPPRGVPTADREEITKEFEAKVRKANPSFLNKLKREGGNVAEHVILSIVVPEIKGMIFSSIQEALGRGLYGDTYRPSSSSGPRKDITSYSRPGVSDRYSRPTPSRSRSAKDIPEIILDTQADADELLDRMDDRIARYRSASVADLYAFLGITSSYTDADWGWTNLRRAGVRRVAEGYLLDFPPAEPLR